jgi:SET domain-containing protein
MKTEKKEKPSIPDKIEAFEEEYLIIKESAIPNTGMGLFTLIPIYKHEIISVFTGDVISNSQALKRAQKGNDGYFINMPNGKILDSMHTHCFAKYANDAKGFIETDFNTNSVITLDDDGNICIVATRNIKAGDEIFCKYGYRYWRNYRRKMKV